jgi:membrane fusion protein, multidrug efflux system
MTDTITTLPESTPYAAGDSRPEPATPATPRKRNGKWLRWGAGLAALSLLAVGATKYLRHAAAFETTDDAYLDARLHAVSARVNGTVVEVLTDDNRTTQREETLIKLDPSDFEVRLEEARSGLASAQASVAQAQAQIAQAQGAVGQAAAFIAQTRAQQTKASIDLRRADVLTKQNVTPQAEYDTASANTAVALANSASARSSQHVAWAALHAAQANLRVSLAKRSAAEAAVHDAELQLSYTRVLAPADGRVGKKSVEVGQRVQPGQALLAVVDAAVWVVANFKESQLTHMRPGQPVEIGVDAIAGHTFTGTIESFAPGTGATFSLLPPDNATGNFTKVVQRVPVKIRFNPDSVRGFEDRLLPGLSVIATVRVRP